MRGIVIGVQPPVLSGPRVVLRPLAEGDRVGRQRHGWHAEIERCFGEVRGSGPMTDEEAADWYAESLRMLDDPTCLPWMVEVDGGLVGVAFLHSLRAQDRKARYAVGFFAPEHLGHGWGAEVTGLVLVHAFDVLDLHRVDLRVLAFNERAIRSYERAGFVVEGRERDSCLLDGQFHDDLIMGILADDPRPAVDA